MPEGYGFDRPCFTAMLKIFGVCSVCNNVELAIDRRYFYVKKIFKSKY